MLVGDEEQPSDAVWRGGIYPNPRLPYSAHCWSSCSSQMLGLVPWRQIVRHDAGNFVGHRHLLYVGRFFLSCRPRRQL